MVHMQRAEVVLESRDSCSGETAQASVVDVTVDVADGMLRVRVCDDGSGGANPATGSGLVGLRDRVEALGQKLADEPGRGRDTLRAVMPLHGPSTTGLVAHGKHISGCRQR